MTPAATADQVTETILDHLRAELQCRLLDEEDGRIGCVTPLEFPNRDNVVVWVQQHGDEFVATDYGEALADFAPYAGVERKTLEEYARAICRGHGVEYASGRLTVRGGLGELGELVWRVASAAAQVSQAAGIYRPRRRRRDENEFAQEVERTLRQKQLPVEREHRIEGRSGHRHRATIFIPTTETVVEPVTGHWNQVTATYAKLGDLMRANGFKLYSLLDDRQTAPDEDVAGLLVQVSRVVEWSRREDWLESVT